MHKIGECFSLYDRPEVFELIVGEHVSTLNPADFGMELAAISPELAFVTSGDAVKKAEELERQYINLADAMAMLTTPLEGEEVELHGGMKIENVAKLRDAAYLEAGRCRSLINKLVLARGPACFLETDWTPDRKLILVPKDPRQPKPAV